jgi:hypothetical protein
VGQNFARPDTIPEYGAMNRPNFRQFHDANLRDLTGDGHPMLFMVIIMDILTYVISFLLLNYFEITYETEADCVSKSYS